MMFLPMLPGLEWIIVGAGTLVIAFLGAFSVWFSNKLGRESGSDRILKELAEEEKKRADRAADVLVQPRTDDDTVDRLRNSGF